MTDTPTSPGATATPGPWTWETHDASMASLHGPDELRDHVLSVSPCESCQAGKEDWAWGRCMVPSEADADLIASSPALLDALQTMVMVFGDRDWLSFPKASALLKARTALALARGAAPDGGEG